MSKRREIENPGRTFPRAAWSANSTARASELLALTQEFARSEWQSPQAHIAGQLNKLQRLIQHAAANVPYYRNLFGRIGLDPAQPLNLAAWRRIPILRRADVRDLGSQLSAQQYPEAFGASAISTSGGSTGVPVRVRKTELDGFMWEAVSLREELWNREDVTGTLANLRGVSSEFFSRQARSMGVVHLHGGLVLPDWGPPVATVWKTGKMGVLQPGQPPSTQIAFLRDLRPDYLLIRPSSLRLLLAHMRDQPVNSPPMRSVWTISEGVDESLREACAEQFGCRIVSNYSASEVGYMGLQCPSASHYHVISDVVHLEVIDDCGAPCPPGTVGRVVVTPLYNYAMPLLRYEIGDEAEVGNRCVCGRGLPVLTRIVGRVENYLTLPSGGRRRVDLSHYRIAAIKSIQEFQLAQTGLAQLELRLAVNAPLADTDSLFLEQMMKKSFGTDFMCRLVFTDNIEKTASGKLLQFVNEYATRTEETGQAPASAVG